MPAPRFSVIIPAYNVETLVARALDSIRAQTCTDYEVIVVDDGSSDATGEVLAAYAARHAGWPLRIATQANGGIGAARNAALRCAAGEFVAFLDADDSWESGKLAEVDALLRRQANVDLVYHDEREVWPSGEERRLHRFALREPAFEHLLFAVQGPNPLSPSAVTVRREVLEATGGFAVRATRPEFHSCEDIDLWLRLARDGARFAHLPRVLGEYYRSPTSITMRFDYHADNAWNVFAHHYPTAVQRAIWPERTLRRLYARRLAANHLARTRHHADRGAFGPAWTHAVRAVSAAPSWWKPWGALGWLAPRHARARMRDAGAPALRAVTYHDVPPGAIDSFRRQIRFLARHFTVLSPDEFLARLDDPGRHSEPAVLVTVDDGFRSALDVADVLQEFGIKALFFVPTGFFDCATPGAWEDYIRRGFHPGRSRYAPAAHLRPMTWDDLRTLSHAGHMIGAHTERHVDLGLDADLEREVVAAADRLEREIGCRVETFAWPFGTPERIRPAALALAARRYRAVFSSVRGDNHGAPRLALRRHAVSPSASVSHLRLEMAGVLSPRHHWARRRLDRLAAASEGR